MLPLPWGNNNALKSAKVLVLKIVLNPLVQLSKMRSPSNSSSGSAANVLRFSPSTSLRLNCTSFNRINRFVLSIENSEIPIGIATISATSISLIRYLFICEEVIFSILFPSRTPSVKTPFS